MGRELVRIDSRDSTAPDPGPTRLHRRSPPAGRPLSAFAGALLRTFSRPGPAVAAIGVALCLLVAGAIRLADARAQRFAAFVTAEVANNAAARNIRFVAVGQPASFDVVARAQVLRRSKGYLVAPGGERIPYQADAVKVCAGHGPECWRVTDVVYDGD